MIVQDRAGRLLLDVVAAGISQITLSLFGPGDVIFFEDDPKHTRPYITVDEALKLYDDSGEPEKARRLRKALEEKQCQPPSNQTGPRF